MSFLLTQLDQRLQELYPQWLDACKAQGLNVRGIQGWRDPTYQDQLHSSGISPLTGSESLHCCMEAGQPASKAFDFGVFEDSGVYVTNGDDPRYAVAGKIAQDLGLIWGGTFVHPAPDFDHIQLAS